jgi:hypothetical protein
MPALFDLTWKPSTAQPDLPTDVYPTLGPAVYRNDGYSIQFTLMDGETPYEPEGELFAQIRPARLAAGATAGDPLAEFEVTVLANAITIALDESQTAALPDSGFWDLQETFLDAPPRTWFTGKVKAWGDVTREDGS